jgi:hypothetical protein
MVRSFNFAASQARGEYLVHLDADDVSLPERLDRQLTFMRANPNIGASGTATRTIWPDGSVIGESTYPTDDSTIRLELGKSYCFCHSAIVVRRSAIGGDRAAFEYAEDLDLFLRLAEHYQLANLKEVLVLYRIHGNQVCARNVEQQILSGMGVRVAARLRAQGESEESLLQENGISRATLRNMGISDEEIDRRTLSALEHHLRLALTADLPAGFEREIAAVIARAKEFHSRCNSGLSISNNFPLIAKVLDQESQPGITHSTEAIL